MKRTSLFLTVMLALTGLVATTGSAHADEFVHLTGPAAPVAVGTSFTHTVTVPSPKGEILVDAVFGLVFGPATITSVSSNGSNNCFIVGVFAHCTQDAPQPAGFNFVMTVTMHATAVGSVLANVRAYNQQGEIGRDGVYTYIAPSADLKVTLDASSSSLLTSRVVYTAHAFNNGPATSPGSTVTTHLSSPAVSVNAGSGCSLASGNQDVICPVGSLASGSGVDATFTVTFPLLTINLALNATATIAGTGTTDPTPGNDTDSAACLAVTSILIVCP